MRKVKGLKDMTNQELMQQSFALERKVTYYQYLLEEYGIFKTEYDKTVEDHAREVAFVRFMRMAYVFSLLSAESEKLFDTATWVGPGTIQQYVTRGSSPAWMLMDGICKAVADLFKVELVRVRAELDPIEAEQKVRQEKHEQEWQEAVKKHSNIIPDTWQNCRVVYQEKETDDADDFGIRFGFSYECRGLYDYANSPHVCTREKAHGHILLACEDGTMWLPFVIRTQADLWQAIDDLEVWKNRPDFDYIALREFVRQHELVRSLPTGDTEQTKSIDLEEKCLGWVLL